MSITTSLFSDLYADKLEYFDSIFKSYGQKHRFYGSIITLKSFEDLLSIRNELSNSGKGKVLIIDGGASQNYSIFDEILANEALKNNWEGIIINGNIRNSNKINELEIGVKALGEVVKRAREKYFGEKDNEIEIAGTRVRNGDIVMADEDGIVVFEKKIVQETKPKF